MRPNVSATAEELYSSLGPWTAADGESTSWALLQLCESLSSRWQDIEDLIRDRDSGPGWSSIMDADLAPADWLPWLGQFIGQTADASISSDQQRAELKDASGWKRGTPLSMITAVKRVLTGTQWAEVEERTTSPYRAQIRTRFDETPSADEVLVAASVQKPAGLILDFGYGFNASEGWTWNDNVTTVVYVCSLPSDNLYPSGALYPC